LQLAGSFSFGRPDGTSIGYQLSVIRLGDDTIARRDELDREFRFTDRERGQHEMQIADFIGLQSPFRLAMAMSIGQSAPLRQAPDDDDAAWRHGIGAVERDGEADMLTGGRLERTRR
jgi:hypothetical protein